MVTPVVAGRAVSAGTCVGYGTRRSFVLRRPNTLDLVTRGLARLFLPARAPPIPSQRRYGQSPAASSCPC